MGNLLTDVDIKQGRKYFEGSLKFQATLTNILNMITNRVEFLAEDDIGGAMVYQAWGIALLIFVMILSPVLIILAKLYPVASLGEDQFQVNNEHFM